MERTKRAWMFHTIRCAEKWSENDGLGTRFQKGRGKQNWERVIQILRNNSFEIESSAILNYSSSLKLRGYSFRVCIKTPSKIPIKTVWDTRETTQGAKRYGETNSVKWKKTYQYLGLSDIKIRFYFWHPNKMDVNPSNQDGRFSTFSLKYGSILGSSTGLRQPIALNVEIDGNLSISNGSDRF